ncbi:MAG TPA: diacylglycerol kinase family protein [Thermoanaerobaculia bacterium]|nr:diacylglycerol kinase family protein [Thermoanaerobaculia bacterium]
MLRFLLNPSSGRGAGAKHLDRLRILATRFGAGLAVSRTAADLPEQARRAAEDGVTRLIVAGGDGTMHLAIQGLAGTDCALGVVPLGSGNDLAGTLEVPAGLDAAVERAVSGPIGPMDLIRVGPVWSASYAGVGFDSEVTRAANQVRHLRGPAIYPWAVIKTLATFRAPHLRVEHDQGVFDGKAMFAVASNLPRFGGGMRIAPEARIDDGLLDLVIVREVGKIALLRVFPKVYSGQHIGHPDVEFVRIRSASFAVDRPMFLYGGGELIRPMKPGEPVDLEVVPGALAIVGR